MKLLNRKAAPPAAVDGNPTWYRDAVVYELRVRSFYDSNGDGVGDFQGATEKLDYLADLGVTAVWILPFYPSPQRDDGYDISDYTGVHRELGTLADFQRFLGEAHHRGLRVITELVLNHTSDQHPWFQRARRAPPGSAERDYYVWSDTPDRYRDARIIFKDFESSNWAWDPIAKAYFWHRFYAHQPDLNFQNPAVQHALLDVVDFWLALGVDGLRLDAVPYLYECEGTSCENLPDTHAFLKRLRSHVDERFAGRMLLAEANQWPEDAAAYFGDGDECQMAFHFPIMPRLFMSIHMEDRFPIVDILAQTPTPPGACQWALFLRNHDELTLEMVTDEERDSMVRAYALDPTMRINLGIRRRLAPLLGNDRRNIELLNGLLFSLPGTPVLYYGDEIGMGDNVYLGDRNGVRTPMQWSADRNAGFSRANPQRLILPVIIDPEFHFEAINVEAQQNTASSLLWWMKRLIALRKRFTAFGRGTIEFLAPENARVLAFVRRHGEEVILVVANLSRFIQFVQLDLSRLEGRVPVELFGRSAFPPIGTPPYLLTLGGHAFYWFSIEPATGASEGARVAGYQPPVLDVEPTWEGLWGGGAPVRMADVLAGYIESRPFFEARGARSAGAQVAVVAPDGDAPLLIRGEFEGDAHLVLADIEHANGEVERYATALVLASGDRASEIKLRAPNAVVASVRGAREGETAAVLVDAFADPALSRSLLDALVLRGRIVSGSAAVTAWMTLPPTPDDDPMSDARPSWAEGVTTTAFVHGHRVFLELFRRLDEGTSPDLEIARYLATRPPVPAVPQLAGAIEIHGDHGEPQTLAVMRAFVPNQGNAFQHAREELRRYFERTLTRGIEHPLVPLSLRPLLGAIEKPIPDAVTAVVGAYLDVGDLLGRRTAEVHLALAAPTDDPAFAPEPYTLFDQRAMYQTLRNLAGRVLRGLRSAIVAMPEPVATDARALVAREVQVMRRFGTLLGGRLDAQKTRCHGDYRLSTVLFAGNDFVIPDFEGDRTRSLAERRRKTSPLRDVASMLRSLHDVALLAILDESVIRPADRDVATPWARVWRRWMSVAFLKGYFRTAAGAAFLPRDRGVSEVLLDAFLLERAFIELGTELERPGGRVDVRLRTIIRLLDADIPSL